MAIYIQKLGYEEHFLAKFTCSKCHCEWCADDKDVKHTIDCLFEIARHICITVQSRKEQLRVAGEIHKCLVGNQYYIDSEIILNIDTPNQVDVYISDKVLKMPAITIR